MEWYVKLTINQKINTKGEVCFLLFGQSWETLRKVFSMQELIEIIYQKMKIEFEI